MQRQCVQTHLRLLGPGGGGCGGGVRGVLSVGDPEVWARAAGGHRDVEVAVVVLAGVWCGVWGGAAVAQSPQRDASTFRVAAGVEWGAVERARAQWRGHLGTLKPL